MLNQCWSQTNFAHIYFQLSGTFCLLSFWTLSRINCGADKEQSEPFHLQNLIYFPFWALQPFKHAPTTRLTSAVLYRPWGCFSRHKSLIVWEPLWRAAVICLLSLPELEGTIYLKPSNVTSMCRPCSKIKTKACSPSCISVIYTNNVCPCVCL